MNNGNHTYVGTERKWPSKLFKILGMNMFEIENSLKSLKAFFQICEMSAYVLRTWLKQGRKNYGLYEMVSNCSIHDQIYSSQMYLFL